MRNSRLGSGLRFSRILTRQSFPGRLPLGKLFSAAPPLGLSARRGVRLQGMRMRGGVAGVEEP